MDTKNLISSSNNTQAEFFTPEKFTVASGTIDFGKEYELKVTTLLALRCYFQELQHFWLASNADGCGALDDIVMFRKSKKTNQGVTYFIQVKHQNVTKPLVQDTGTFLSVRGDYSFKKYSKGYNEINKNSDSNHKSDLLEHLSTEMEFIILTNRSVKRESDDKCSTNQKFLSQINGTPLVDVIGCKGDIFQIHYEALAAEPDVNIEFLKKLYLVTNQPHCKDMNQEIKNIIKENVGDLRLSDMNLSDIAQKFVDFIDDWSKGHLDSHYPLTKMDISKKLAELLLLPYMAHLQEPEEEMDQRDENAEENIEENEEENIWYHIIKDKDVTIIDEADEVVLQYLTSATYNIIGNRHILSSITKINRQLLRVVSDSENMSKDEKYELLWKTRTVPLLLQVSDEEGVQQVQEILKQFPEVFRVIILNKTKTHLEQFQELKAFTNLTELSAEHQEFILRKPIKLQSRELPSIKELNINQIEFLRLFKVKDIVQILRGQFNIGGEFEKLPDFSVEMSITRNIFDIALLKEVGQDIFVVKCNSLENFERLLTKKLGINSNEIIYWERVRKNNLECRIIIFDFNQNLEEVVEFVLKLNKKVHLLVWDGENTLELMKSTIINENLKTYKKTPNESVFAKELLLNFYQTNQTMLISANPGMGKSVLMNYFAINIPTNLWVLKINLAKHKDQYKDWDTQNCDSQQSNFESFYKEVLKEQQTMNNKISYFVFEQFLKLKNVVYLCDAYDEVPVNRQNGAKQLIKFINQSGYSTCVTTRPMLEHELELTLNTFAMTLNMFTINEQTDFLINYFANIGNVSPSDNRVISFVAELLRLATLNLNDMDNRFTGIPLQTKLLAEVFTGDFEDYLSEGILKNQKFDLIYLYQYFVNEKIKIAFSKVESVSEEMIDQYKTCRSFYALRHLFAEHDLQELEIDQTLHLINKILPHTIHLIQKDGIVVTDSHSNVTFVHQTYAEYLVADWLAKNMHTSHKEIVRKLIKKIFHPNFLVVRNMFDRILAKNCPLHIAIINRQIVRVKELIALDESAFDTTDDGGRTILHLMAAWGTHHPWNFSEFYKSQTHKDDLMMIALILKPHNKLTLIEDLFNYTPLDYAMLSRSLHIADRLSLGINNPCCFIDITEEEANSMLKYVKEHYFHPLRFFILKCLIRTCQYYDENNEINRIIRDGNLANLRSVITKYNVNAPDTNGCTPLHTAVKVGQKDITLFLLTMKAKVNTIDKNGRSALHSASYLGHLDIIPLLLSNEAKVNTTDCHDLTPLHYALLSSSSNQADIVSLLIKKEKTRFTIIRNALNTVLKRPLQDFCNISNLRFSLDMAACLGQTAILKLLLLQNVDINVVDCEGVTPLIFAIQSNQVDSVNLLLINGADIETRDIHNRTPLHFAAYWANHVMVTVLLTHGADIAAKDSENKTPFHLAVQKGHYDVVTVLLKHGADINAIDYDNKTPLHLAAEQGHYNVVTLLLTHGADINAIDSNNKTSLHLADEQGHHNVVTVLLRLVFSKIKSRVENRSDT